MALQHADLVNSFYARVYGYVAILTDDYPPIGLERAKSARLLPRPTRAARGPGRLRSGEAMTDGSRR